MAKSTVTLSKTGDLTLVIGDQVELTKEEKSELNDLQTRLGMLGNARTQFMKQISELELKLMQTPEFQMLNRLREKSKTAGKMIRETQIVLDSRYEQVFVKRGLNSDKVTQLYASALPDTAPKGKRGRPRKLLED